MTLTVRCFRPLRVTKAHAEGPRFAVDRHRHRWYHVGTEHVQITIPAGAVHYLAIKVNLTDTMAMVYHNK